MELNPQEHTASFRTNQSQTSPLLRISLTSLVLRLRGSADFVAVEPPHRNSIERRDHYAVYFHPQEPCGLTLLTLSFVFISSNP